MNKPWNTPQQALLESDIENPCKRWAKARGWFVRKYKSPGNRSAPDDIFVKDGRVIFVEFKAPGKSSTELQTKEQNEMESHGCEVYRDVDNIDVFKKIIAEIEEGLR